MATKKPETPAWPATLGASIDLLYTLRAARLDAQRKVDKQKEEEAALEALVMQRLKDQDTRGGKGSLATVSITQSTQADITDWPEYLKWCVKKKAYSGIQQRVGIIALREHWDNKEQVPGVTQLVVEKLSITKAGA